MAGETQLTIIGNLTADPELRFTPGGDGVANFTVASTPRTFDRQSNEWKDGDTLFMRCAAWRELSENVAESLLKGMRVIVTGRMKSRSYETKEGEKRTVIELEVDEVGPSLRYATAKVERTQRGNGQQGGQGGFGGGQQAQQGGGAWGGQQAQQGGQWGGQQGAPAQQGGTWGGQPQTNLQEDPWATPGQPPAQQGYQQAPGQQGGWNQGTAAQQAVTRAAQGAHQQGQAPAQGYAQQAPGQGEPPF